MANYQEKLDRILKVLSERTGIVNPAPGSVSHQLAQSIAYESFLLENKIEKSAEEASILYATDSALDEIGEGFFGIERIKAKTHFISESMLALKFYVTGGRNFGDINNNQNIIIPEGTIVSGTYGSQAVRFKINKTFTLPYNYSEGYVSADMIQGTDSPLPIGTLNTHTFSNYSDYNNNSLLVKNVVPIATGRTKETDDDYRYRIKNTLKAINQATFEGVYQVARSVAGVSDVIVQSNANGGGTFTVFVQGITPITGDDVISSVNIALQQECVSPWVYFTVTKPGYIGIQISVKIVARTGSTIATNVASLNYITNTISSYVNNFYGDTFYFDDLLKIVNASHDDILDSSFVAIKVFRGTDLYRESEFIDLETYPHPSIEISDVEKLIMEQVADQVVLTVE